MHYLAVLALAIVSLFVLLLKPFLTMAQMDIKPPLRTLCAFILNTFAMFSINVRGIIP